MSGATVNPAAVTVSTARPAVTVRSSGVAIVPAALAVTTAGPAVAIVKKAITVTTIATRGSVIPGDTAREALSGASTAGAVTALLSVRRDLLAAAPDTDSSLDAAATTGEGGP